MKVTPARGPSSSLRHFRISVEDTVFFQIESPMSFKCFRRMVARWAIPGVLGFSTLIAVGQTNGIFADFATSMGSFTCQLDYTNAPRTVANFIGLALASTGPIFARLISGSTRSISERTRYVTRVFGGFPQVQSNRLP